MPWGEINYQQNAESLPKITIASVTVSEAANAGETVEFTINAHIKEQISGNISFRVNFRSKYVADEDEVLETWLIPTLVSGSKSSGWAIGEDNIVTYSVEVPDYLASDNYQLQFDTKEFTVTNSRYNKNIIRGKYVAISTGGVVLTESRIEKDNGRVQLIVNGEKVAPMMYLREQKTVFNVEYAAGMYGAGVDLMCLPNCRIYNMNSSGSMWNGYGKYDFSSLDGVVYETLQGAPSAKLMLMLDADPPEWWFDENPGSYAVDSKGKRVGISYASQKWREDVGVFYRALLAHVLAQPYAGHMFAVKIAAVLRGNPFGMCRFRHGRAECVPQLAERKVRDGRSAGGSVGQERHHVWNGFRAYVRRKKGVYVRNSSRRKGAEKRYRFPLVHERYDDGQHIVSCESGERSHR